MYLNRKSIAAVFMLVVLLAGCKSMPVVVTNLDEIEAMAEKYRRNVVQISVESVSGNETKNENGFGFVVGEKNGSLYIVTAKHVICNDIPNHKPKIHVRFYKEDETKEATLIDEKECDLSILKVERPAYYTWNKECYETHTQKGDYVWFIGIEKEWNTPSKAGIIFEQPSKINFHRYKIEDMPSVTRGTSGAPLFRNQGIIGMITEDGGKAIALDIEVIKESIEKSNTGVTWDILNCQGKNTAITKAEIDRIKEDIKADEKTSQQDKVKQLSEKADSYLKDGKYLEPKDENAFDMYKEVLQIDSNNSEALQGILDLLNIHREIFKRETYIYTKLFRDEQFGKNVKEDIIQNLRKIIKTLEDSKTICTYYIKYQQDKDGETKRLFEEIEKHKNEYQKKLAERLN